MQPLSGNQRPDLLTSLMKISLVMRLPHEIRFCRSSSNVPRLPSFLDMLQKPSRFAHFSHGAESLAPATQNDASKSKSGANMVCFVHFELELCFAPQRRALFHHLNFQKCSRMMCVSRFDLEMCFAPQGRALFQHLNFQKCSELGSF